MSKKVGALIIGLNGATANTAVVGTFLQRKGLVSPESFRRGMLTGDECLSDHALVNETQIVFGGWDVSNVSAYKAALTNRVIDSTYLQHVRDGLEGIRPMRAIYTAHDVDGVRAAPNTRNGTSLAYKVGSLVRTLLGSRRFTVWMMLWLYTWGLHLRPVSSGSIKA